MIVREWVAFLSQLLSVARRDIIRAWLYNADEISPVTGVNPNRSSPYRLFRLWAIGASLVVRRRTRRGKLMRIMRRRSLMLLLRRLLLLLLLLLRGRRECSGGYDRRRRQPVRGRRRDRRSGRRRSAHRDRIGRHAAVHRTDAREPRRIMTRKREASHEVEDLRLF